ncbi:MAG: ATP-grasp domain-containing protein [Ruminococcaceae bacterium]|nr:ATP-grasp domain-containing protein [Oscillospiraceae bacterium]
MKNILILSAGRRVELIERFKRARKKLEIDGNIIAVDISKTAPAIYFADRFYIISRICDEAYIDDIIDVCKKENIDLIVPTIDTELLKLAENRDLIEKSTNAKVLLSDMSVVSICRDKNNTQKFFEENGFGVPRLLNDDDIKSGRYSFPLFIKPKDGSSSINTFKINNKSELDFFMNYVSEPMVQEFMQGTEYSVDVFCDFDASPITIVPRVRLATRSGEIAKGKVVKDREIINDVKRMLEILKPIGHITIQCMKTQKGIEYIEINPRFGGGAPMSIDAGADSCENLYRLLCGEELSYNENYSDNTMFVRFDSSIMLDDDMELVK